MYHKKRKKSTSDPFPNKKNIMFGCVGMIKATQLNYIITAGYCQVTVAVLASVFD